MHHLKPDNFMLTESDMRIPKNHLPINKLPDDSGLPVVIEFNFGNGRALGEAFEDHETFYAVELLHPATEQQTIAVPKRNVVKILTKKEAQDLTWFLEDYYAYPENYENLTLYGYKYRKKKISNAKPKRKVKPANRCHKKIIRKVIRKPKK